MLWPRSLSQPEHQQQQIMVWTHRQFSLGDPRQSALPFAVYCAQNLWPGLLPGCHGEGCDSQRPDNKQTSRQF